MATTESRSGFRLPWSADRAPSRDDSEDDPEGEPSTGDSGQAASETDASAAEAVAPVPDDQAAAPAAPVASIAPAAALAAAPVAASPSGWRPTKFLVDMTHAMQAAAQQARAATLEQFRVEGSSYIEQLQGRSVAETDALRRRAEADVASIKDWSKAEIARIREETEARIAGRRGQLDGQLARHAALVERDVARIEGQIASFEAQMAAFFDELLAETDLTILAVRAQEMPEAPAFDQLDETAFTKLMTEPAVGVPVAAPIAEPEPAAEAAASLEATTGEGAPGEGAPGEGAAETPPTEPDAAPSPEPLDDAPAHDPRLAILGLTPDFEAAEAAAAEAAAAEISEIPGLDEENLVARLAGLVPSSTQGNPADASPIVNAVSTQVVVTGLVSVASIASFKRNLSRCPGVHHVGVSSGPDGEFLFTVQHEAEVSLRDVIPTLPGFQARVTGGGGGVVTASAHDPED
jgi:F0F1-type ATP synthase membrane subunit b/b'